MDPISISTGILAFLGATYEICTHIERFLKAPNSVRKLHCDIQLFEHELENLSRQCSNPRVSNYLRRDYVRGLITKAQADLEKLKSRVAEVTSEAEDEIKVRRLSWVLGQRRSKELEAGLQEAIKNLTSLTSSAFRDLLLELSSVGNLQITHICAEQATDLELHVNNVSITSHQQRRVPSTHLLKEASESTVQDDISMAQGTTIITPPCRTRSWTRRHQGAELSGSENSEQRASALFPGGVDQRCRKSKCRACQSNIRCKKAALRRFLRRLKAVDAPAWIATLPYSVLARGTLSEGSDANRYAKTGNVAGLRRLLGSGVVQLSATTPDGWTLLHASAFYGQLEMVDFLLKLGANFNRKEDGNRKAGDLARMRALNVGATSIQKEVASLIPGGEFFKDDHELTPIHAAALDLYDAGDKLRPDLPSLLEYADDIENALKRRDLESIGPDKRKESMMFEEIFQFYAQARTKSHLRENARIIDEVDDIHGWTPFLWATITGHGDAMEILLNNDADPFTISQKGRNAIHLAAESRYSNIMQCVLNVDKGPQGEWYDINRGDAWKETPLHIAASGSAACVRMLLERGADREKPQENGKVPLHYAALVGDDESTKLNIVDQLSADRGAHINVPDEEGLTPVFDLLASAACVALLAERGADLSVRDARNRSLFHHAASDDNADSMRLLLKSNKNLATARDKEGNTPISQAFACRSSACAKILLEHDALADFDGKDGWYLVHHAALWGDADVLEAVLKHPSFVRGRKTRKGESSAQIAKSAGGTTKDGNWTGRVRELLLKYDSRGRIAPPSTEQRAAAAQARMVFI